MLEEIKERNSYLLTELLNKYNIDKTVKELLDYESVFLSKEYINKDTMNNELKRAILYANLKYVRVNGTLQKTNKKEILFNFGKKAMRGLSENKINKVIAELSIISSLIKQSKLILRVEIEESDIQNTIANL